MIQLIFLDVDGTLVGSTGDVHPRVWAAVEAAQRARIRLAISSGRPGFGITRDMAQRLDPDGWHVFQNGASVVHLDSGASRSTALPPDAVSDLVARARAANRLIELYTDQDYAFDGPPRRAREHAELLGLPFHARPLEKLHGVVVRAQWLLGHDEAEAALAEVNQSLEISGSTSPAMPDTRFLNFTAPRVSKASAVRVVAEALQIDLQDVMFVGDGWNDAEAMRLVGWPIAMANAEEAALEVARVTVGHVDEGAAADAISLALAGSQF